MSAPTTHSLPHSLEAEEHLISCCLIVDDDVSGRCIAAGISPRHFYDPKHGIIFACIASLRGRGISPGLQVLAEELKTAGQLDAVGGLGFLVQVSGRAPTTAQAGYFAEKVRDLYLLREIIRTANQAAEAAGSAGADATSMVASLRADLDRLTDSGPRLGSGVTAAALCANPPAIPHEIIAGVLYGSGTMMLSGPSKSRKTYTFLDLSISVATGKPWIGFNTSPAGVAYLNFELSEHSFQRRVAAICSAKGVQPPANLRSFNLRGKTATMAMLSVELPRIIKAHNVGLVVLDPWYKIAAQSGADENSNDGQARILAEAERIVTSNGAALVVGHHFAKGDSAAKNAIDRAAGAGAMARWGDVVATLSEHEEEDAMSLEMFLRDFPPVRAIALRWEQPVWIRDDGLDPAKLKRTGRREENTVDDALRSLPAGELKTSTEWMKATGMADGTFRRKRDALLKAGKVEQVGNCYRLKSA